MNIVIDKSLKAQPDGGEPVLIGINKIRADGGTQMREAIDAVTVATYAGVIEDGGIFPPVVVFYDGADYWLADGFHRLAAHKEAGEQKIAADVRSGTRIDAVAYAMGANHDNGLPRKEGDYRRAYQAGVREGMFEPHDAARVAEMVRCSMRWARYLTKEARDAQREQRNERIVELHEQGLTQREIAQEVGLTPMGVNKVVNKRNTAESLQEPQPSPEPTIEAAELATAMREIEPEAKTYTLDEAREKVKPHVAHNSGNNEWYTPPEYIDAARQAMGSIDTDPASSEIANKTVGANIFFTKETNGLAQKWHGNVWMNPPYAQPLISDFSRAITDKFTDGEISQACVLVNNATETQWFQYMLNEACAVCFTRGRVRFLDVHGNPGGAPLQGQAVLYFGDRVDEFTDAFSRFGSVLYV